MAGVRVLTGYRVLKDDGSVATDATATFYLAGTSTLQEVFSNYGLSASLGSAVSASVTGVFPDIFVSDAISVKVIISATGYTADTIDYLTVATSGALTFAGTIYPAVSDGGALGTSSNMWSDLFLASGAVVNWNAGDVTLTHSANLLTFAGASSGYAFDAAPKPSSNDGAALGVSGTAWADLFLASGAVINFAAGDVTLTHSANLLAFAGASSGYTFDAAPLPSANDGAALGASGTAWSDLFLASGGVINFNAGDVLLTHSSNTLAFTGASTGYTFDAPVSTTSTIRGRIEDSSETGGALTSASANRRVICASAPTLPSTGMTSGEFILIDPGGTARTITRPGGHTMYIADTDSATGTSRAHNVALAVYHGSSKWTLHGTV
jgi:hypothetical protein